MPPLASKIMVLRHAEKPPDDGSPLGVTVDGANDPESLTVQGWQRAGALTCLFAPERGPLQDAELSKPRAIFASQTSPTKGSRRPLETITLLATRLGITPTTLHKDKLEDLAEQAQAAEGGVLICWQHEDIPAIAHLIPSDEASIPPKWPGDRYDVVWVFDLDPASNTYRFSQVPQCLLADDSQEPIAATGS